MELKELLYKDDYTKEELAYFLSLSDKDDLALLAARAMEVKEKYVGKKVYYRGLVEFSNICEKDCYYCGIRRSNSKPQRYNVSDDEILKAAKYAYENGFGSLVLQSGELSNRIFVDRIDKLLRKIKSLSNGELGITLSCGEQTEETYKRWFESGAHRYLLRIESSVEKLYYKIHPNDDKHNFGKRLDALYALKKVGYQTGTGVMIGLPFQTYDDLADDLLFFKKLDIDMCGMGPYIEHEDTPMYKFSNLLMPKIERFRLALRMIAVLRILMKDINIAAATALQAIDPIGREKALKVGANIIMPNVTATDYRKDYLLYEDKPCIDEEADECKNCLEARIHLAGDKIGYNEWGDSIHFKNKKK
ncbi:MAG: [FeFe] hydrogenase H-cluster radical SAM maturase HydE [Hyphomicrobiales bacterium]